MAWTPTQPPAHTSGATHFDSEFNGLRFALVKLDNYSLHVHKPRWTCGISSGSTYRFMTANSFTGANNSGTRTGGFLANPGGCNVFNYTGSTASIYKSSCVPYVGSTFACCEPPKGYTSMINCEQAYEPGYNIPGSGCGLNLDCTGSNKINKWQCFCYACRRHKSEPGGCASSATTGDWFSSTNYSTSAAENIHGIGGGPGVFYFNYGSSWIAPQGKGAYNDTKWYKNVGASFWAVEQYAMANEHNGSYYGVGMTMRDITIDSSYLAVPFPVSGGNGPNNAYEPNGTNKVGVGNVIWDTKGSINFPDGEMYAENVGATEQMAYYAIILIPTDASQKSTGYYTNKYSFKLHHDNRSLAYQKFFGSNWPIAANTQYGNSWVPSAHQGADPEDLYGATWDPWDVSVLNDGTDGWYIAESNTGMMHNTYTSTDNTSRMFGGIMDGEFEPLDSPWWDGAGNGTTNPWHQEILSELQRHMIVEACYFRLDTSLVPAYTDRYQTILVTKTPACAPSWEVMHQSLKMFNVGQSSEDGIELQADNPYFNLHVTDNSTGKTIVFKDVATGLQDFRYGSERHPPTHPDASSKDSGLTVDYGGYSNVQCRSGLKGMTIAAELVGDWEQHIFGVAAFSWSQISVQTLRTVGWDDYIKNPCAAGGGGAGTNVAALMGPTIARRGVFYEFDAKVYLNTSTSFAAREMIHLYGDATDGAGCLGKVHNTHPVASYGGHTNVTGSSNMTMGSHGWIDTLYGICYIGLQSSTSTSGSNTTYSWPGGAPESLMEPENLFTYSPWNQAVAQNRMIDHTTGVKMWPDHVNAEIYFMPNMSIRPYPTNAGNNTNEWAICTGNGMVYNTHPLQATFTCTCTGGNSANCSSGTGSITVTIGNVDPNGLDITGISFTGGFGSTTNPVTNPAWVPSPSTITSNTSYTFTGIPVGAHTVNVNTTQWGTISQSLTVSAPPAIVTFNLDSVGILTQPTCTGTGIFIGQFDAANTSGGPISNNGNIQWTLFEDIGGTWTFDSTNHPFQDPNVYGSGTGSPWPMGKDNINGSGNSCNNKKFWVTGVTAGTYRLVLHNSTSQPSASTDFDTWMDYNCFDYDDITVSTGVIALAKSNIIAPSCNVADSEVGYAGPCNSDTGGDGIIDENTNLTPSNVGSYTITATNATLPVTWSITSPGGVTHTGTNTLSWTTGCGASGDNYPAASAGTHTISITDNDGCTDSITVVVPDKSATTIVTTPSATNPPCSGGTGIISGMLATTDAACTPMQYAVSTVNAEVWNNVTELWELPSIIATWQPTSTFSAAPGTYYVWAKSACGCATVSGAVTIGSTGSLSSTIAVTNPGCSGGVASIAVSPSGGTGPYTYTWTTVNTGTNGVIDPLFVAPSGTAFTQAAPGGSYDYEVEVMDANGCIQILTASTIAGAPLTITAVVSSISCAGGNNGSIDLTITGGTAGYTYQWSGSSTATTQDLSTLAVGTYTVVVTDSTPTTACTVSQTFVLASTGGAETWIDINQYVWSGYNTAYGDGITGTGADDLTYGLYGGPTCPASCDGTIRLMIDSTSPVIGASFPFEVWLSNDGGANFYRVATSAGGTNWLSVLTTDLGNPSTGVVNSTGVVYDPQTGVDGLDYFEITGNVDKWNTGSGDVVLPFCENSTWIVRLVEDGVAACSYDFSTTILPSDYRVVYNQPVITHPTCCGCSSYGASLGTNVCNGSIDNSPIRGTYENHVGDVVYTYLWEYATLPALCTVPGHNNTNTQWANQTTQDLTAEWPGIYTITTTDSCSGTDVDDLTVNDPVVYIDDITWVPPQCIDCCTGTLTITAHGGNGNLEVSINHGVSFTPITSPHTFTGMCGGINSIWLKDSSNCVVEYFADPDDQVILSSYDDNCFANANTSSIISTSGSWVPTYNDPNIGTATAAAFTESSSTKIELIPVSNFTDAQACITTHNIIPGDTNGEMRLVITGGTAPYEVGIVAQSGPFYSPTTGMTPCWGIGPLTQTDPCTMTGDPISNHAPALDGGCVMSYEPWGGGASTLVSTTAAFSTSLLDIRFNNVSVSRDLGYGALGAEYIFYVKDAHGCYQTSHVGMDNGIFGIISVYGAMNCDCVCPIGFTYNEDTEECDSSIASPAISNGTLGYWTRSVNLYSGQTIPAVWQSQGCALYGIWTGAIVDYSLSLTINTNDLPFTKDIVTNVNTGPNDIYRSTSLVTQIGSDTGIWNTNSSATAMNTRINDIAIWLDQSSPAPLPPIPVGEWIGCIMEISNQLPVPAIIAMASDAKMRMKVDGVVWIDMISDESVPTTVLSNYRRLNLFPIVLPGGLHTIAFEVYNTVADAFMAFEIYANQDSATGNYFIGDCVGNSFSVSDIDYWTLEDVNGDKLSSLTFEFKEIQLGETTYGYSCTDPNDAVTYSQGGLFCYQDVTAPCEVPLDCGYCLSDVGVPKPQFTKKGPCEGEDDGGTPTPALLNNVWVVDYSELSDLVECPGALANVAYAKLMGALATRTLDVRQIWMTIIIRHLLHNLNTCMTLSDIQDLFAGFLDDVCPTCDTGLDLTPAQMEALTTIFTLNTNQNFDF